MADEPSLDRQQQPFWAEPIEKVDPSLIAKLNAMRQFTFKEGALPTRTKVLMMMLSACYFSLEGGTAGLAALARKAGASDEEIKETLHVAFLMGGMPALNTGIAALKD